MTEAADAEPADHLHPVEMLIMTALAGQPVPVADYQWAFSRSTTARTKLL